MYSNWTVQELKSELKTRGGSLRGRKADLVSRLEAFDRNQCFGYQEKTETGDVTMEVPPMEHYRDINSNTKLPPLTKQHIQLYFDEHEKSPQEGLRLYEARFLVVIRAAIIGQYTYIKGICKASMKRLQYVVNLKLNETGIIEESSCECVAGSGVTAHCKHVAMMLYGVEHMVREKILIKHQTTTEQLQKFRAPRSVFTASPMKSSQLPMKRKLDTVIFSPCEMKIDEVVYNEKFRSLICNYTSSTMPFKQLYEPANPYAIEVDHSYSKISPAEKLLDSVHLNNISPEIISTIETQTSGQTANKKWLKARETRITSSKFHTICHLKDNSQKNMAKQILEQRKFSSKATTHGIINEQVALQKYMEDTDLQVVQCGLFVSQSRPYLAASPDGLLGDETVIEIKCPYASRYYNITHLTVPYLELDKDQQLTLKKTSPYYYQVQGQMYCTNRKFCNFIIYTYKDFKVLFINRDESFIAEMLKKLDYFYINYFKEALVNKYLYRNYHDLILKI